MTYFKAFELSAKADFQVVAGRPDGLKRLMVMSGRLPTDARRWSGARLSR